MFFISLIIIGVMIFLNLFLAILLDNFDDVDSEDDSGRSDGFLKTLIETLKVFYTRFFDESQSQSTEVAPLK